MLLIDRLSAGIVVAVMALLSAVFFWAIGFLAWTSLQYVLLGLSASFVVFSYGINSSHATHLRFSKLSKVWQRVVGKMPQIYAPYLLTPPRHSCSISVKSVTTYATDTDANEMNYDSNASTDSDEFDPQLNDLRQGIVPKNLSSSFAEVSLSSYYLRVELSMDEAIRKLISCVCLVQTKPDFSSLRDEIVTARVLEGSVSETHSSCSRGTLLASNCRASIINFSAESTQHIDVTMLDCHIEFKLLSSILLVLRDIMSHDDDLDDMHDQLDAILHVFRSLIPSFYDFNLHLRDQEFWIFKPGSFKMTVDDLVAYAECVQAQQDLYSDYLDQRVESFYYGVKGSQGLHNDHKHKVDRLESYDTLSVHYSKHKPKRLDVLLRNLFFLRTHCSRENMDYEKFDIKCQQIMISLARIIYACANHHAHSLPLDAVAQHMLGVRYYCSALGVVHFHESEEGLCSSAPFKPITNLNRLKYP